ncbi:cubilin [Neodiprion pinetum]|uniref:cubilin n=1 Tax=Neodiprion pinetum TaxID=441929 RepID=UPI001EDF9660|nr:cubilin [Neodiprion pinetum]
MILGTSRWLAAAILFHLSRISFAWLDDRPVLDVRNGNLFVTSAKDRNITLETVGTSYVTVNGIDLMQAARSAKEAAQLVERWKYGALADLQNTVKQLTENYENIVNTELGPTRRTPAADGATSDQFQQLSTEVNLLKMRVASILSRMVADECASNPCQNGGTCEDMIDGYKCRCREGWEGPQCNVDVNECAIYAGTDLGCQNGAECTNLPGTYECRCKGDWYGIHCTKQSMACNIEGSRDLCGHGVCVPTTTGVLRYTCICDQGWERADQGNPACVKDIDECSGKHPACSVDPLVTCVNLPGSYSCGGCPAGYTGNGYRCVDINECAVNNGGCSISPRVECVNTRGSRECGACPSGYSGNGEICVYVGVCSIDNGGCHLLATCLHTPGMVQGTVQCRCPPGYMGDGMGIHGCWIANGGNFGPSACSSNPCSHGSCVPVGTNDYRCNCQVGYKGINCNIRNNPCDPNPCRNEGTCRVSADGSRAICRCTSQFSGPRCSTARQSCGGTLTDPAGTLQFPSSGNVYQNGLSCAWALTTNTSLVLNVTFIAFKLENSNDCQNDFVQIHDGGSAGDHMIGRYCGDHLPNGTGTIISSRHTLYLWFHSDHSISDDGFTLQWNSITPLCGGEIIGEHGTIRSPGSPGKYPPNRDCDWHVETSPGKKIQFHFYSMALEQHPNCDHDNLTIRGGPEEDSQQLGLYCNHTQPPPLITPGNEAWLHFHSDGAVQDNGFQITFSSIAGADGCGGVHTDPSGYITSPRFLERYEANQECEWKIQVANGERIKITWVTLDVENSENCHYDYVELFDGDNREAPSLGKFCGRNAGALPPDKLSSSNTVLIRFVSDWSLNGKGFHLRYEVWCGGEFTEPTGVIKSPYYPNPYPASKTCIYEIIQPLGKAIRLTIQSMDIEDLHYNWCRFDYLKIHDGDNENSTLIGTYCGTNSSIPESPIMSTHNYLWIKFVSDYSGRNAGFLATYTTLDVRCGGILKAPSGVIHSPSTTNWYGGTQDCTWIIQAPPGQIVKLDWHAFDLEDSSDCRFDYVKISQNLSSTSQVDMGTYCGSTVPLTMMTQSRMMTIRYYTDESITRDGFMASYIFIDGSKLCGGNYYSLTGVITSPNYPNTYPERRTCEWTIIAPNRHQVLLNVTAFELERFRSCSFDYLEIRNGGLPTSPLIGKYCGTEIANQTIQSFSNKMYLKFVTDQSVSLSGFRIEWDSNTVGCGGTLSNVAGTISSPNYPQPYSHNAVCTWSIKVAAGSLIQFVIIDIELEEQSSCYSDYIEIFEGPYSWRDKKLGRYCNSNNPLTINTTTNIATIRFRSDFSGSGRGFHINYRAVCHRKLDDFRGVIESPNFPNNYPNHENCSWLIEAPMGNKLNITFSHFDLEQSHFDESCLYDYLTIKEGVDNTPNRVIGTYCGLRHPPSKIVSTESQVFLQFISDGSAPYNGFRLEWVVNGCGGVLNKAVGTITSPGYPEPYPANIECKWTIEVDYTHSIEVTFVDVQLETVQDCQHDRLTIYGGASTEAPILIDTCGMNSSHSNIFTSSNNKMLINFKADHNYQGTGFKITYRSVNIQCGGRFTTPTGVISSPNYPNNYPRNRNCEWLIQMPPNHHVNLTFTEFDVEHTGNCTDDYVRIYDGSTRDAPILGSYCGNSNPPTQISYDNELLVVLRSDSYVTSKGFSATYNMACGGRIAADPPGFISIDSPLGLHTDVYNCTWIIVAPDLADHVTITLTHLQLSKQSWLDNCEESSLQIYEGEGTDGPLLKRLCSTTVPPPLTSQGNAFTVQLSSFNMQLSSFTAMYSTLNSACGGNYTSEHGTIATPGYPDNYPRNVECVWILPVSPGNSISLSFTDFAITQNPNCNSDYLEVREDNAIGNLEGIYCGSSKSNIISNKTLWMKFETSNITTEKGFRAEYHLLHNNDLTGPTGKVTSPLYPRPCMLEGDYSYRITVHFTHSIQITFEDFHLETYTDDCNNLLTIYDGYDAYAPKLTENCGLILPESVKSSGNVVYIVFSTTVFRSGSWFHLSWLEVPRDTDESSFDTNECEEIISLSNSSNSTYVFHSPGWPEGYDNNLNCNWIFESSPGTHLALAFHTLDLEEDATCLSDQVKIYSGTSLATQREWSYIGSYCHPNMTYTLIQTSNLMKVEFHSDSWINKTGFSARVYKVCGGELNGPNGVIEVNSTSPMGRQVWSVACQWNVTVRPGRKIEVTIIDLNIETGTDNSACSNNFLMLKNGGSSASPLLGNGKYCGQNIPGLLTTTGNQLYVYVVGTKSGTQFKLSYREVGSNCGSSYRLTDALKSIQIKTPNFPNIPHPYTECSWTIMAPSGQSITIHFESFDLTSDLNCAKEYLEVRDGGTDSSSLMGLFCSDEIPSSMITTGNFMYLHFYTDVDNPKQGFKAIVSIENICGGTLRGRNNRIQSPNYPSPYPDQTTCTWRVLGPPGHTMKLQFQDINLPRRYRCNSTDHVDISAQVGNNRSNVLQLGQYCGNQNPGIIETPENNVLINFTSMGNRYTGFRGFSMNISSSLEACGGFLTGSSGEFQSPGYPNRGVPKYRGCVWKIILPEGYRVKVDILDMGFGTRNSRSYWSTSQIAFSNDLDKMSRSKVILADSTEREAYSTSNTMTIFYWSASVAHKGFKARYSSIAPALCGSATTNDQGVLISNQNPVYGMRTFSCNWKVSSPTVNVTDQTLALTITGVVGKTNMQTTISNCENMPSHILISGENQIISCISGNFTQDIVVRSPMPVNKITSLKRSWGSPNVNFTINYRWHQCGGILSGPSHTISAPRRQTHPVECAWYAKFPDNGETIALSFIKLNMSCDSGYILIRYGGPLSPLDKTKYCGYMIPGNITSGSNELWIEYHSSASSNDFEIQLNTIQNGCGGMMHGRSSYISSPNFPQKYPNNAECTWFIEVENGYNIGLVFVDRFHLEESTNCANDFIQMFEWKENVTTASAYWSDLGKVCGRSRPSPFNSTSNRMKVLFRSNDVLQADGFHARWNVNCGGTLLVSKRIQYLTSPGWPVLYENNLSCEYTFLAPQKYFIIEFTSFELERGLTCRYDNVTISYSDYRDPSIWCGNEIPTKQRIYSHSELSFKTDETTRKRGFELKYYIDECGGEITEPSDIRSPSLDESGDYHGGINCTWTVKAPPGKAVLVRFESFDLESSRRCRYDYVAIYNTSTIDEHSKPDVFCGTMSDVPLFKRSDTGSMIINFITDYSVHHKGFRAKIFFSTSIAAGCGGHITLNSQPQTFRTQRGTTYEAFEDCHWLVKASSNSIIKLTITSIDLKYSNFTSGNEKKCSGDYLEIHDGDSQYSELIDYYCGNIVPSTFIVSSSNRMWIRLVTDGSLNGNGVTATLESLPSPCGNPILTVGNQTKTLTSPGFGSTYEPGLRCNWILSTPITDNIQWLTIHFDHFDLESSKNCNDEKLMIIDKNPSGYISEGFGDDVVYYGIEEHHATHAWTGDNGAERIYSYCGNRTPHDFYSTGRAVEIKFISSQNPKSRHTGFKLGYSTSLCNRNFTGEQGRIRHEGLTDCWFTITAAVGYTISLYFTSFNLYDSRACTNNALQIRDGNFSASVLDQICGVELPSPIFSSGNQLSLHSWSSNYYGSSSYDITYTTTKKGRGCGGKLYNYSGRFTSPLYPQHYRNASTCTWEVSVPAGNVVVLDFENFNTGSEQTCHTDFLQVVENYEDTLSSSKFCGPRPPSMYTARTDTVQVEYHTSLHNRGTGWTILFFAQRHV